MEFQNPFLLSDLLVFRQKLLMEGSAGRTTRLWKIKTQLQALGAPAKATPLTSLTQWVVGLAEWQSIEFAADGQYFAFPFSLSVCASFPKAERKGAEGLWGHPASHQKLLPHRPQKHPRQVWLAQIRSTRGHPLSPYVTFFFVIDLVKFGTNFELE